MPIKPENKSRYPANWKEIRLKVLERAGNRCEFCGARNHSYVYRPRLDEYGNVILAKVKIVLTVAHLDRTPENCGPGNLRALCQKCHLDYDRKANVEEACKTRLAKKLAARKGYTQLLLFESNGR